MISRRGLFGAVAALVAAPFVRAKEKPIRWRWSMERFEGITTQYIEDTPGGFLIPLDNQADVLNCAPLLINHEEHRVIGRFVECDGVRATYNLIRSKA